MTVLFIGRRQSPINIVSAHVEHVHHIYAISEFSDITDGKIHYDANELKVVYNGGQIVYHSEEEDSIWRSAQFHFHSPSEHTIDGRHFDLEMHSVLSKDDESEQMLVLAILFERDDDAEDIDFISALKIDQIKDEHYERITHVPLHRLIESVSGKPKYNYQGSLTTPPCFEIVEWFVVRDPIKINGIQLQHFKDLWSNNPKFGTGFGNNR